MTARTDDYDEIVRVVQLYLDAYNENEISKLKGGLRRKRLDLLHRRRRHPSQGCDVRKVRDVATKQWPSQIPR